MNTKNKADHSHRPNQHEVRIGQEAKEDLEEPLRVDQAGPQMRPHRRPSKAEPKEPTTYKPRKSTTPALMEACTVVRHITERLVENTPKQQQCSPYNAWAYRC